METLLFHKRPIELAEAQDVYAWVSHKKAFETYIGAGGSQPQPERSSNRPLTQMMRVLDSARYLADHMHRASVLIIPCIEGRVENAGLWMQASLYGSILPATWSLILALRSRGLGAAWTTLHLQYEKEVAAIVGIPDNVTQAALLPVAYFTGTDFKPAKRLPAKERTHWNSWEDGR